MIEDTMLSALKTGEWLTSPWDYGPVRNYAAVTHDDLIYIFGGYDGVVALTKALLFDGKNSKDLKPIPIVIDFCEAVSDGRYIYLVGGNSSNVATPNTQRSVLRYDPIADSWLTLPFISIDAYISTAWLLNGFIYVLGYSEAKFIKYEIATGISTNLAYPATPRIWAGKGVTYENNLYLFGGIATGGAHSNDVWKYDPVANSWSKPTVTGTKPAAGRYWGCGTLVDGRYLLVVGGANLTTNSYKETYVFDILLSKWHKLNSSKRAGYAGNVAALGDNVYRFSVNDYRDGASHNVAGTERFFFKPSLLS